MKTPIFYILMIALLYCSGCYNDEVIDAKPGERIEPVTNLDYAVSGNEVTLSWSLPGELPDDIIQPVSIHIRTKIDGQDQGAVILDEAPGSYTFSTYDASKAYRFTVKILGRVDTTDPYESSQRYSLGQTVAIQ